MPAVCAAAPPATERCRRGRCRCAGRARARRRQWARRRGGRRARRPSARPAPEATAADAAVAAGERGRVEEAPSNGRLPAHGRGAHVRRDVDRDHLAGPQQRRQAEQGAADRATAQRGPHHERPLVAPAAQAQDRRGGGARRGRRHRDVQPPQPGRQRRGAGPHAQQQHVGRPEPVPACGHQAGKRSAVEAWATTSALGRRSRVGAMDEVPAGGAAQGALGRRRAPAPCGARTRRAGG